MSIDVESLRAQMAALPMVKLGVPRFAWTPELDKILLEFWPTRNHDQVSAMIGVSSTTALKRYRELRARS